MASGETGVRSARVMGVIPAQTQGAADGDDVGLEDGLGRVVDRGAHIEATGGHRSARSRRGVSTLSSPPLQSSVGEEALMAAVRASDA